MKSFIKIVFWFIFPIICIGGLVEVALRNIPNNFQLKNQYITEHASKINTLVLGSSHTFYGVNPDILVDTNLGQYAFNGSNVSQSLNYDYFVYEKLKGQLSSLKTIVVAFDYLSPNFVLDESKEKWRLKNYCLYMDIHPHKHVNNYFEILSHDLKKNIKRILGYYYHNKSEINCYPNGGGIWRGSRIDFTTFAVRAAQRHSVYKEKGRLKNISYLEKLINEVDSDVEIILVSTPLHQSYSSKLNEESLDYLYQKAEYFTENYSNCKYLNFSNDDRFKKEDFGDGDHLNIKGAKKFTEILKAEIDR